MSHNNHSKRYSFIDDPWGWLDDLDSGKIHQKNDNDDGDSDEDAPLRWIDATSTQWRRIPYTISPPPQEEEEEEQHQQIILIDHHPHARCSHSLTPIGNSCALLFGGGYIPDDISTFCHFNDVWLFNGLTSRWKRLDVLGDNGNNENDDNEDDDNDDNDTSNLQPSRRRGHMAEFHDDKLWIFGGITDEEEYLNDLWMLDLTKQVLVWERLGPPPPTLSAATTRNNNDNKSVWPSPRRGSLSFVYREKLYIFGGETRENHEELEIYSFDLSTTRRRKIQQQQQHSYPYWTKCTISERLVEGCPYPVLFHLFQAAPMRNMMHSPSIFCQDDATLYVFGGVLHPNHINRFLHKFRLCEAFDENGNDDHDGNDFCETCVYQHPNETDVAAGDDNLDGNDDDNNNNNNNNDDSDSQVRPLTRYFHGGCAVGRNSCVIAGGVGPDGNTADSYAYNMKNKKWTLLDQTDGPGPRNGLCMVPLNDRHVLLFGGGIYQTEYFDDTYVLELGGSSGGVETKKNNTKNGKAKESSSVPSYYNPTTTTTTTRTTISPALKDHTPIELVVIASNTELENGREDNDDSPPPLLVEMVDVETLSTYSEYFRKMFDGPFLEASKKQIRLSEVDPKAASICIGYMREQQGGHRNNSSKGHGATSPDADDTTNISTSRDTLQGMEMEELDSIVTLADMWGMHSFLKLLEDVFSSGVGDRGFSSSIEDELGLLEYAKLRGFPKLARKCLKRIKSRFQSSSTSSRIIKNKATSAAAATTTTTTTTATTSTPGTTRNKMPPNFEELYQNVVDPMLLQEVKDFVELSLL